VIVINVVIGGSCNCLACIASVSVGLWSKENQRNGIFGVLPRENGARSKKRKEGEGKENRQKQTNPWILKTAHLTMLSSVVRTFEDLSKYVRN